MRFEANLAGGIDRWALRAAGLEVDGWGDVAIATLHGEAQLPTTLRCRYLADGDVKASVTVLAFGGGDNIDRWRDKSGRIAFERVAKAKEPTRVRIEIDDDKAGHAVRQKLEFYSFENDGELNWWKEHSETWEKIDEVLGATAFRPISSTAAKARCRASVEGADGTVREARSGPPREHSQPVYQSQRSPRRIGRWRWGG